MNCEPHTGARDIAITTKSMLGMKNREERKPAQRQPSDMSHQGENYRKSSKRELHELIHEG